MEPDSKPKIVGSPVFSTAERRTPRTRSRILERQITDPWRLSGSVNRFTNDIDALETTILFPTPRPFALAASRDDTWVFTLNNRIGLPRAGELQLSYIHYARRNVPQGRERARSSLDLSATWPIVNDGTEGVFTFTDIFNDFAVEREIEGQGFTAVYRNFLETQAATVGVRTRF